MKTQPRQKTTEYTYVNAKWMDPRKVRYIVYILLSETSCIFDICFLSPKTIPLISKVFIQCTILSNIYISQYTQSFHVTVAARNA